MTAPKVTHFENPKIHASIRSIQINGAPWFSARDICLSLGIHLLGKGYANVTAATGKLNDDEKTLCQIEKGVRSEKFVSESGLYKLIMRSDKPLARAFQDWVTRDVLPSIRKDGIYIAGQEKLATGEISDEEFLAQAMIRSQRVIDRLKATVETQADTISRHLSYMTVDEFFALKHIYPASGDNQSLGRRASTICKNTSREKRTQKRYAPNIQSVVEIGEYPVDVLEQAYDDMVTAGRIPMNIPQIALQIRA